MRSLVVAVALALAVVPVALRPLPAGAIEPDAPERLIAMTEAIGMSVRELVASGAAEGMTAEERAALTAFYGVRAEPPLWIDESGLNERARLVAAEIGRAADWGLDPAAFKLSGPVPTAGASRAELARAELTLSVAVLTYARHARGGRIPEPQKQLSSYLDRKPQLKDPGLVLEEMARSQTPDATLAGFNPQHRQFLLLRDLLARQRTGAVTETKDTVVRVPSEGPSLAQGKSHPDVAILRQRLKVAAEPGREEMFDEALTQAVKAFQKEAGLGADGVVGRGTRDALNGGRPSAAPLRESAILANMEQWRWMPEDLGDFHITVNVPEYMIRVMRGGDAVHTERVIVGEIANQTPVFSDQMQTVVFHPFWGVPDSIKVNELLPSLARGSALERQGLRLQYNGRDVDPRSIDWGQADIRNFHVYQPPGSSNVLGVVKFLFPNQHQTYMHDTPTKNLFNASQRTFSHGCMRVRNPLKLAEAVMGYDRGWTMADVDDALANGPENNNITLERKIPVHMTYFTVVANPDGTYQTFNDVYGHEKRITLALAGKWGQIDKGRDHLAPVQLRRPEVVAQPGGGQPVTNIFQALFGF